MDATLRFAIFALAVCALLVLERAFAAHPPPRGAVARLSSNVVLGVLGVLVSRLLAPAGLAAVAEFGTTRGIGAMHLLGIPDVPAGLTAIAVLDCAVYWQHRVMHRVSWLWQLHAVHHADPHIDVTTAVRFHPVEIALSWVVKAAVVLALGAPAWAVLAFEVLLSTAALFNHANLRLSPGLEVALRTVLITPELHRIHHATAASCRDRNFGFSVSLWDRLFGTSRVPAGAESGVDRFGLDGVTAVRARSILAMLACFRGPST